MSLFEIFHDHCLSEVLEAWRSWPVLESSDDEEIDIYTLAGIYRLWQNLRPTLYGLFHNFILESFSLFIILMTSEYDTPKKSFC